MSLVHEKINIVDVNVSNIKISELMEYIEESLKHNDTLYDFKGNFQKIGNKQKKHLIFTPNPEIIVNAYYNKYYKEVLNSADIAIADGFGLILAGLLLRKKINRVTGIKLMTEIIKKANKKNWRIGFLGAKEHLAQKAAKT